MHIRQIPDRPPRGRLPAASPTTPAGAGLVPARVSDQVIARDQSPDHLQRPCCQGPTLRRNMLAGVQHASGILVYRRLPVRPTSSLALRSGQSCAPSLTPPVSLCWKEET